MRLEVLYEDNHVIVCIKPAGVLSQAGSLDLEDMLNLIKSYLKEKYDKPGNVYLGLVHRLDTNVGGVMVFAKTSKAAKRLSEQLREHDFTKRYLAVVRGKLPLNQTFVWEDYLIKDEVNNKALVVCEGKGKHSKVSFSVLENLEINGLDWSLVNIDLLTGRFHQIRVQFASRNHQIYNDGKYGETTNGYVLGLYAYEIEFTHPIKKDVMRYVSLPRTGIFKGFSVIDKGEIL